jgi:hypothetical protein
MNRSIVLLFLLIIFTLTSFQNSKSLEIFGTYTLNETTLDKVKTSHKIELQKENICNWYTLTKGNGHKEKCNKKGYFEISGNKIVITWSRNECENCGTYANWYDKDCPFETLEYKEDALWTTDKTPKRFTKVK